MPLPAEATPWTQDETTALTEAGSFLRVSEDATQATACARSRATFDALWAVVDDIDAWVAFLPYVTESTVTTRGLREGTVTTEARFALTTKGLTTRYKLRHARPEDADRVEFAIAPVGVSPLRAAEGAWTVTEWSATERLLCYAVDVDVHGWVPDRVAERAARNGPPRLVTLVARRAEQRP